MDEFAFGLSGENAWAVSPPNHRVLGCIVGGSSSGSAAAVAGNEVDLALGTDTGGSVRVPASWCGLWGWRPSYGSVSCRGVEPLAKSLDVLGVLANSLDQLKIVASILLPKSLGMSLLRRILIIPKLWGLAELQVNYALNAALRHLASSWSLPVETISLKSLGLSSPTTLLKILVLFSGKRLMKIWVFSLSIYLRDPS